jgi:phosphocarrier protein FPr
MIQLTRNTIKLNAIVQDKADAIRQAGTLLIDNGNMKPEYITSMMEREKVADTYLGNGIAIPHGMPQNRDWILQTGVSIVQIPTGLEWNRGERVHLVIGIAAKSDEHLAILTNLTHVLDDEATIDKLAYTSNPDDIITYLTQPSSNGKRDKLPKPDLPQGVEVTLSGKAGLHARPATQLVNLAKQFVSEIRVRYQDQTANAKSLVSLLKLGVEGGQTIRLMAQGSDANQALATLRQRIEAGLEPEIEESSPRQSSPVLNFTSVAIPGIPASPGLAIGPLFQLKRSKIVYAATAKDPTVEAESLRQAIEFAKVQLQDLYESVEARSGQHSASIFLAHQEFLNDNELIEAALNLMEANHSAAWAWHQSYEQRAQSLEALSDPLLASRAVDLRDVGQRVLRLLADTIEDQPDLPDHPVILVAENLIPSDIASLDPALILGFCTAYGGPTSHSVIIARSLDIPAIVGAGPAVLQLANDTLSILDGDQGNLYPQPSPADLEIAETACRDLQATRLEEKLTCYQPALMTDGHRVEVVANIGLAVEAEQAVNAGAEGVGLLRTEFLFLDRSQPPTEDEQLAAYTQMTQALNGLPLIIRILDVGGDKPLPYIQLPAESNPFLGVRGIRLCLQRPDLFKPQLRAVYRASQTGPVKLMFPMVTTLEDLQAAKAIAETIRLEVGADPIEIGIMVEVPAAALMASELAEEVDFFSIGTNDLTQYTLAIDRGHPALAKQADGLHPAVLRLIHQTIEAADTTNKWVGVCGGIAGDPKGAAILVGLGVTELSVSIPSVAAVKAKLRQLSFTQTQVLAQQALSCRTAAEVRALSY